MCQTLLFNQGSLENVRKNMSSQLFCGFRGWTNSSWRDAIFKKNVDVLIDSSGMTRTSNLGVFKLKPSKNQISWAGWLASTNLKEMDYVISDHFCTRQKDEKFFTEKVLRMKNIWCTYSLSVLENLNLKKK